MAMENSELKRILETFKVVAVVGLSRQPNKDSNIVAKYLKEQGYRIIPVNPSANEILGEKAYADLLSIPEELQKTVEVVCVFRPSDKVMPIVEQAVQMRERFGKPHVVWMQRGIINHEAAKKAEAAGIKVIMDRCMMVEHEKLIGEKDEELERIKQKKLREMLKGLGMKKISAPIHLDDSSFDETLKKHRVILVDFWAPWCGPCNIMSPIIEELAAEYAGKVSFGKLNVDENPLTAKKFGIMGIPTLIIFRDGEEVSRIVGVVPKNYIKREIEKHL